MTISKITGVPKTPEIIGKINEVVEGVNEGGSANNYPIFTVNSGNVNAQGEGDLLLDGGSSDIEFKVGGDYESITVTNGKGEQYTFSSLPSLDLESISEGSYNAWVTPEGNTYYEQGTIYVQDNPPAMGSTDVWMNTSIYPYVVTKGSTVKSDLTLCKDVPLGSFTVSSGSSIEPWTQPTLSANGTLGGSSFAVSASSEHPINLGYKAYFIFASNANSDEQMTWQTEFNGLPASYTFYNPDPLNVTNIRITNRCLHPRAMSSGTVYGSNDGSSWTILTTFTNTDNTAQSSWDINLSSNTTFYKYYKIGEIYTLDTDLGLVGIGKMTITATKKIECSISSVETFPYNRFLVTTDSIDNLQSQIYGVEDTIQELNLTLNTSISGKQDRLASGDNVSIEKVATNISITEIGTLTKQNATYSGFSSSNYLSLPTAFTSSDITEGQIVFTTSNDITTAQGLFLTSVSDDSSGIGIYNGEVYLTNKQYGSYTSYVSTGLAIAASTKYYFKFTQNGTIITPYLSTDGENYTQGTVITRTRDFGQWIGRGLGNDIQNTFSGSVNLVGSYLKGNNYDWVGATEETVISATDTTYTAGTNVSISDQNVISAIDTTYTAGTGISISDQNVISATGGSGVVMTIYDYTQPVNEEEE